MAILLSTSCDFPATGTIFHNNFQFKHIASANNIHYYDAFPLKPKNKTDNECAYIYTQRWERAREA